MNGKRDKKHETEQRRVRNVKQKNEIIMPVPVSQSDLPDGYANLLASLKKRIQQERIKTVLSANCAMVMLYWDIGASILERQQTEGWGAKVIDRLSFDLKEAFPDMKGFSSRNLKYMRKFAESWRDRQLVQRTVALIPWRSNLALLDKLKDSKQRLWYAEKTIENGWSRDVLSFQIETQLHKRLGNATNNFEIALPPADSDMASQIFKDPYIFDFLGTAEPLFYHLKLRCYVVIELKAGKFQAGHVSQLNMYMNIVDDLMRHPDDKPTIGLLLVKEKNKTLAKYALAGYTKPIGVAEWERQITDSLPENLKSSLPTIEEIEAEFSREENDE
jgi:predicted nuclease of restriction endonuclease-like (RecB) superfamily